jgi:hypothetical protein
VRQTLLGIALCMGLLVRGLDAGAAEPDARIALVIGNGDYAAGRLPNAVLDARAMASTLRGLGFEVLAYENTDYRDMRRALAEFGERLGTDGVGLFYYAGHGLQVSGRTTWCRWTPRSGPSATWRPRRWMPRACWPRCRRPGRA